MPYKLLIYQHAPMSGITNYLRVNGFQPDIADDSDVLAKIKARNYDACILDYFTDARYTLIRRTRELSSKVAVIFLTSGAAGPDSVEDAVAAFDAGADDYMRAPYSVRELVSRLNAVLRRSGKCCYGSPHSVGDFWFDPGEKTLTRNGQTIKLPDRESELLLMLSESRNTVLSRNAVLKALWVDDNIFNNKSLNVHITKLRRKLEADKSISIISLPSRNLSMTINNADRD